MNKMNEKKTFNNNLEEMKAIHLEGCDMKEPYFRGMYNGMVFAGSLANGKKPEYINAPEEKKTLSDKIIKMPSIEVDKLHIDDVREAIKEYRKKNKGNFKYEHSEEVYAKEVFGEELLK